VTPPQLETYVNLLARALKARGREDARILEEVREHLVDAIEGGRRRGLSMEDAEREALERFGTPEMIAAHVVAESEGSMNGLTALLGTVWLRRWWIVVPSLVTALATVTASYYVLPTRDQRADIRLMSANGVPWEDERLVASGHAARGFQLREPLTAARLEKLIADLGLSVSHFDVSVVAHDPNGGDLRAEGTVRIVGSTK